MFDAQPTASERQRENLSSRLRREFGLALPEDDDARPATDPSGTTHDNQPPFGPSADYQLTQARDLGTWAPNLITQSQDAWPHSSRGDGIFNSRDGANFFQANCNIESATSLPGYDNLVLLGQTAQNVASLETCRRNIAGGSDERQNSPNAGFGISGRRFKWGRRGV